MVFSRFNFLEDDTRIIKYQNIAYKIKLVYRNCSEEILPSLTPKQSHEELEQVFRAILYADQRNQKLPKIKTKHFLVSVLKKGWKTSGKLNFQKDDTNIKCYSHMFEFTINANPEKDVRFRSGRRSKSRNIVIDDDDDSDSDIESRNQEIEHVQRSRSKTRKSDLNTQIKTKDCKVVLKRIDSKIFNKYHRKAKDKKESKEKRKGGKENAEKKSLRGKSISYIDLTDDIGSDVETESEQSDTDGYSPSDESVDMVDLDDIESDGGENRIPKTIQERSPRRKRSWRKLYVPKYNQSYKDSNIVSDISSDSNSSLSNEEIEMSDGSFKPAESSEKQMRKRIKKRKSPRKPSPNKGTLIVSYKESSDTSDENINSDIEDQSKRTVNEDESISKTQQRQNRGNKKLASRKKNITEENEKSDNEPSECLSSDEQSDNRVEENDEISSDESSGSDQGHQVGKRSFKKYSKDTENRKSKTNVTKEDSSKGGRKLRKSNPPEVRKGRRKKNMKSDVEESSFSEEDSDFIVESSRTKRKSNKKKQQRHNVVYSDEEMSSDDNTDEYVSPDDDNDNYVPSDISSYHEESSDVSDEDMPSRSSKKSKITNRKGKDEELVKDKGDNDKKNKEKLREKSKVTGQDTNQEKKRTQKKKNILVDENMNVEHILGSAQKPNKNRDKSSDTGYMPRRSRKLFTAPVVPLERLPSAETGTMNIESLQTERKKTPKRVKTHSKSPDSKTRDKVGVAAAEPAKSSYITPRKSKTNQKEHSESERLDQMRVKSPLSKRHPVHMTGKDRYLIQQEELEETMKLRQLSKSDPRPVRKSPRKRRGSGIWDVVDTIITPIKRLMTK